MSAGRLGSLCSGYEGLGSAVMAVLGGSLAWVADNDPGAAAVLAHRFPLVPNLGDITAVDWAAVEPVDVLCAGFPCQDISCAGKRGGLREGTRSGLWYEVARAIGELRPPLVVIENVKELLSERADSDMEPCTWCLGDTGDERAMRALGAVLADLAALGFDAEWISIPAAAVGCCHLRWRVFVLAWPAADAGSGRLKEFAERDCWALPGIDSACGCDSERCGEPAAHTAGIGAGEPADEAHAVPGGRDARPVPGGGSAGTAADAERHGRQGRQSPAGGGGADLPEVAVWLPTPIATDAQGSPRAVPEKRTHDGPDRGPRLRDVVPTLLPTPTAADGERVSLTYAGGNETLIGALLLPTPTARLGDDTSRGADPARYKGPQSLNGRRSNLDDCIAAVEARSPWIDWRQYEAAVRRHEAVFGGPAPCPVEQGRNGYRLSPRFVEWMMGLPAGWVTDVPGLSRNAQLRALGNGVVPAQAELAIRLLLARAAAWNEAA